MRLDPQWSGKLVEPINAYAVLPPFQRADISAIDPRGIRQRFLGQPTRRPQQSQISREILSAGHRQEWARLSSDPPRSMLIKDMVGMRHLNQSGGVRLNALPRAVARLAPSGGEVVEYDRRHIALYAALLDTDDAGQDWQHAAMTILDLDPADADAEHCWRSHLDRARWIVGDGMAAALKAFGERKLPEHQ